jgi:molybdopterin-guanine dinucleotide biosynthesis protein A
MTKRTAIILAGGEAKRFQTTKDKWQDKALAELDGKPLMIHAIEHVEDIVEEIIVVVNENESRIFQYHNVLEKYHVQKTRIVTDQKMKNLSGPLIAILTGLKFAMGDFCITVPCDVPMLNGKVVEYLFSEINDSFVVVPMWPNGRLETLLMVLDRKKTLEVANVLCQLGRSHPDDIIRGSLKTLLVSPLGEIKVLDPNLCSFVNINCQEDLCRLQPRYGQGQFVENVRLNLGVLSVEKIIDILAASSKRDNSEFLEASKIFSGCAVEFEKEGHVFWAAVNREYEAKSLLSLFEQYSKPELKADIKYALLKAAQNYGLEAKIYEKNRCYFLAERARADKSWSELEAEKLGVK